MIDAVGPQVDPDRVGQRVWVFLAQSRRPFGTAAEYVAVPSEHAVLLPEKVPLEQGALLGIAGITGHRAIFTDGPVRGQSIVGDDNFPEEANQAAAADLTETTVAGDLLYPIAGRYPLEQIADAHEAAEQAGATGRIVIDL